MRITAENQAILKRIQLKEPFYNHLDWEEDAKQHDKYVKNICEYPVPAREGGGMGASRSMVLMPEEDTVPMAGPPGGERFGGGPPRQAQAGMSRVPPEAGDVPNVAAGDVAVHGGAALNTEEVVESEVRGAAADGDVDEEYGSDGFEGEEVEED